MNRGAAALLAGLALAGSACFGGAREPVPDIVNQYLHALMEGRLQEAYDLTDLKEYPTAPGFALSFDHFESFHRRNPLERFSVASVFRQQITEHIGQEGRPFWTIDIVLTYGFGVSRQSVYVEGRILPKLQVDATAVAFVVSDGFPDTIGVDGVPTSVSASGSVTVLPGEHELTIGGASIRVATDPLAVIEGPARIEEGPPAAISLT